jgi:hypothetical protein
LLGDFAENGVELTMYLTAGIIGMYTCPPFIFKIFRTSCCVNISNIEKVCFIYVYTFHIENVVVVKIGVNYYIGLKPAKEEGTKKSVEKT